MQILKAYILIALLAVIAGCAINPVTGNPNLVLMSESQEIALGKKYHPQILQQYGVYEDSQLQDYVAEVGRRLAAKSHRNDLIYRFTVLDTMDVNAFALPGGYVYITRGIMAFLNSEAELGGVLAHEIGHITARHGVQQQTAKTVAGIFSAVVYTAAAYGSAGYNASAYSDLSNILGGSLLAGYSRSHELQADRLGSEYLARAGYNTENMINVIDVLKDQQNFAKVRAKAEGRETLSYHGLFATHPSHDKRLRETIRSAKKYQAPISRDNGKQKYFENIQGLLFGQNPEQGVIRQGKFLHPKLDFAFTLPKGWLTQNLPSQLVLINKNKNALMTVSLEDLNKRETPREYLYRVLKISKPQKQEKEIKVAGYPGYSLITKADTQFGKRLTRFTVIFKQERAYLFAGAVKDNQLLNQYDSLFLNTALSFHALDASEKEIAKPYRFALYRVEAGDTYNQLALHSPLNEFAEEQLRLINGDYPNGELVAGRLIKILE